MGVFIVIRKKADNKLLGLLHDVDPNMLIERFNQGCDNLITFDYNLFDFYDELSDILTCLSFMLKMQFPIQHQHYYFEAFNKLSYIFSKYNHFKPED